MDKTLDVTEEIQILPFKDLIDQYDHFLLDAYGVYWGSWDVGMIPGAKETMEHLVSRGKTVGILSNSTQLVAKEKEKLARHGVQEGSHYHFLLTSGEVARQVLLEGNLPFAAPRKKYALFVADHPRYSTHSALFQGTEYSHTTSLDEADFIYIAIPHIDGVDQESPEVFIERAQEIARQGIPVLCANPDRFAHEGSPPRLVVRQGTIAHLLEENGARVHYIGKPYSIAYERALKLFPSSVRPEEILMVGDTPETDMRGARRMGLSSALVTKTGVMMERIKDQKASFVISQLPEADRPKHAIGGFDIHGF